MELTPQHESTAAAGKRTTESGVPVLVTTNRGKKLVGAGPRRSVAIKTRSPGGTLWIDANRVLAALLDILGRRAGVELKPDRSKSLELSGIVLGSQAGRGEGTNERQGVVLLPRPSLIFKTRGDHNGLPRDLRLVTGQFSAGTSSPGG